MGVKTYWYNNLYVGEIASRRKRKIIRNIKKHKNQLGVYVITLPRNSDNLLDIYPSVILNQRYYVNRRIDVVGICGSRDEAFSVITEIVMDCYNNYGNTNLADMFNEKGFSKG